MLVKVLFSIIICDKLRQCPSSVVTTCTMTRLHPRPPLIGGQLPPVCRQPPLIGSGSGSGHVTWILASDWSRLGPSQHRSQLWPESGALNPVSIWAASSAHIVSKCVSALQPKLSESSQSQLYRGTKAAQSAPTTEEEDCWLWGLEISWRTEPGVSII